MNSTPQQGFYPYARVHLDRLQTPIYGKRFLLAESLTYVDSTGLIGKCPEHMLSDGRSGPHVVYPPIDSPYLLCYLDHDHHCYVAMQHPPGYERDHARAMADWRLRDSMRWVMEQEGRVSEVKLRAVYRGVRLGAWASRNKPAWLHYPRWTPDMSPDWNPYDGNPA